MAVKLTPTSKEFKTEYRNGSTFAGKPLEFSTVLQENVGEFTQLSEVFTMEVIFNEFLSVPVKYTSLGLGGGIFTSSGTDFVFEGLRAGQSIDISDGDNTTTTTVTSVTGAGNITLLFDDSAINLTTGGWLTPDATYTNLTIRVRSVPTYLRYSYGIMDSATTPNNYESPIDGSAQSYQLDGFSGAFQDMDRLGSVVSWDLSTKVQAKFNSTTGNYVHEFEILHEFRTAWYVEDELGNLAGPTNPTRLAGDSTQKYVNGFEFGYGSTLITAIKEDPFGTVGSGNLGYYNEALNGFPNIFTLDSYTISNASGIDNLEASEINTCTAVITCPGPGVFAAGQQVIVNHSACPPATKYASSFNTSDEVFLRDSILLTEGGAPANSSIITGATLVLDSPTQITITWRVTYTGDQQNQIDAGEQYLQWVVVGDQSLTALTERPVNLIAEFDRYTKNTDVSGQIANYQPYFYNPHNALSGTRFTTDWSGWDGDFMKLNASFDLTQTNDGNYRKITSLKSQIVAWDGTTDFVIKSKTLPIDPQVQFENAGYIYQIIDLSGTEGENLKFGDEMNSYELESTPTFPAGSQPWVVQTIIPRIPWRDWVANDAVPSSFYDNTKPNNNQNEKSSNYQTGPFLVYHRLRAEVTLFVPGEDTSLITSIQGFKPDVVTIHNLWSDHFDILDFDVDGGLGFSANQFWYDTNNDLTDALFTDEQIRIEIEFDHGLGVLPIGDLTGYIWVERDGGTTNPYYLHTDKDYSNSASPLEPSNTLLTGNTQFVEVISASNKVTFICYTNPDNIDKNITYNIYGRLEKKTP